MIKSILLIFSCNEKDQKKDIYNSTNMMIRISEIQIDPNYLEEYISVLKEESAASVKLEPGVISIYPMFQKENPTEIRILEIYANKEKAILLEQKVKESDVIDFVNLLIHNSFEFDLFELNNKVAKKFHAEGFKLKPNITIDELDQFIDDHKKEYEFLTNEYDKKIKRYNEIK